MTGDQTSTREKLGSIFFAVVMVTSMVAVGMAGFAGSAAAQQQTTPTDEVTVDDDGGADFTSIQDAINASGSDTLITVEPGTYNESLNISNSNVSIEGAGIGQTVIVGNSSSAPKNNVALLIGGTAQSNPVSVENVSVSGVTVEQNDTNSGAVRTTGSVTQSNITIENSRIVANGATTGFGAYLPTTTSVRIANNEFAVEGNSDSDKHLVAGSLGGVGSPSEGFTVEGNDFSGGAANVLEVRANDSTVQNNDFSSASASSNTIFVPDVGSLTTVNGETDADAQRQALFGSNTGVASVNIASVSETISQSTDDVVDQDAAVNVSISSGTGINEGTINVSVTNQQTDDTTVLVNNGSVVNGTATDAATLNGTNESIENVNVSLPLQEGDYDIDASAETGAGTSLTGDINDAFAVDMAGQALEVVPDDTNPLAGNNASVGIVAVDQNGNQLLFNDTNAGPTAADIQLSTDDPQNATIFRPDDSDNLTVDTSGSSDSFNTTFNVRYSEVGDLEITAQDFSGTLDQASATQTYTATVDDVAVTAADGQLRADGSATEEVTLQLLDQNGDPVPRSGESVSFGIVSGNAGSSEADASLSATSATTDSNGTATTELSANNAGFTIEVAGQSNTFSDSATVNTTPGDISVSNSEFEINNLGPDTDVTEAAGVQVGTDHNLTVRLRDGGGNGVPGVGVEFSANRSGASFGSPTATTNDTGVATTTVTLPEEPGTTQFNVSAGAFNASETGTAQLNVTAQPADISTLQFGSDAPASIAPESTDNQYTIETADAFGNLNESTSSLGDVTLNSSDASVIDFDGSDSATQPLSSGNVTFNVDANSTGSATLTASVPDENVSDATLDVTVAEPAALELTPAHNVVTSDANRGENQAALEAQFVDSDGDALGVNNQNITFARQSGNAAELTQSADFTQTTGANGNTTILVNGTANTGETTFIALAENFSVQGSATVTTTGPADTIGLSPESTTISQGETVNVTAEYLDTEDRNVPILTQSIGLSTDSGAIDAPTSQTPTLTDGQVNTTFVFNATETGQANLTALGNGLTGSTTLTVEEAAASEIDVNVTSVEPAEPNTSATYNADVTFTTVGDETAQFVSVDFGDQDVNLSNVDADSLGVNQPDGSSLDIADVFPGDSTEGLDNSTLVIQLGDTISDANENDTYTVSVPDVDNGDAGEYTLTLGLHESGDEILGAAAPAYAADSDTYTIGDVEPQPTASVTFDNQTIPNGSSTVTVDSATLSDGGFVAIHSVPVVNETQNITAVDSVVGVSEYLENGTSENITVTLNEPVTENQTLVAMPHLDTNGNETYDFVTSNGEADGPYTANGAPVTDSASITVEEVDAPVVIGDSPATDTDGDGTFEDVNGDGEFDIVDINALFQNRNSDVIQNNTAAFDFNGDGEFNIVDVNALFQDSQA